MSNVVKGAASGLVATVPMTAVMIAAQKFFPAHASRPLPPQQITEKLIDETSSDPSVTRRKHPKTALLSHFLFGAVMGGLYSGIVQQLPRNKLMNGMVFGSLVWTASYAGWLPLLHLQPSPQFQPRGRNFTMILSHLVWGATLSGLESGHRRR